MGAEGVCTGRLAVKSGVLTGNFGVLTEISITLTVFPVA